MRQWTDPAGAVLAVQSYGPFGEARDPVATPPWGYTGEWQDPTCCGTEGMVYLRARWYNPALGRFTQVDPVAGILLEPATQHPYAYALGNPGRYTDPTGRMPVWALRFISQLYNTGQLDAATTSTLTLILNGGGVFTALHEIAQLNAAKRLHDRGLESILEYSCGGLEVDIVSGVYAWEVKPLGTDAQTQLLRYMQVGNLLEGDMFGTVEDIPIFGDFKMRVAFDEPGGIHYSFTRNAQGVTVPVFIPEIKREYERKADRVKAATAVAVAIVAASVVLDFFTGGGSIADDPESVAVALKAAQLILAAP